ncbi:hypothetical protein ACF08N_37835 [Streptomyces sp. NPDC015127]
MQPFRQERQGRGSAAVVLGGPVNAYFANSMAGTFTKLAMC